MNKSGFANGGPFFSAVVYCGSCGGSRYRLFACMQVRFTATAAEPQWLWIQSEFLSSSLTVWLMKVGFFHSVAPARFSLFLHVVFWLHIANRKTYLAWLNLVLQCQSELTADYCKWWLEDRWIFRSVYDILGKVLFLETLRIPRAVSVAFIGLEVVGEWEFICVKQTKGQKYALQVHKQDVLMHRSIKRMEIVLHVEQKCYSNLM